MRSLEVALLVRKRTLAGQRKMGSRSEDEMKPTLRHDDPSRRYDSEELSDIAWCW
jgi:hypothetical protein